MADDAVDRVLAQWRRQRPELDTSPLAVIGRISRAALLLQRELVALYAQFGLQEGDFDVLATLRRHGDQRLTPGDLTRATMVTTGGMTKRLDRLEANGWIRRDDHPRDRRGKEIALTEEGRELIDRALEAHYENEKRLVAALTPEQREQLASLLRELLLSL
jgi:DNA-binding MarR family transcriptional regulator